VSSADRDANILGALALIITDRTEAAIVTAAGHSASAAAALSALHQLLPQATVDTLRRVLGLTPSGAVRLVDRLAEAGHVTRGPGPDGRSRSVTLTAEGRRVARRVARARADVVSNALAGLSIVERETLTGLMERVLGALVAEKVTMAPGAGGWTCRLCDAQACGRTDDRCPAASAARTALRQAEQGGVGGGVIPSARAT
jgi:DNA-binding MarR family transcriptional regulator